MARNRSNDVREYIRPRLGPQATERQLKMFRDRVRKVFELLEGLSEDAQRLGENEVVIHLRHPTKDVLDVFYFLGDRLHGRSRP